MLYYYSTTPLHYACLNGHKEITSVLLDAEASIEEKDNIGYSNYYHLAVTINSDQRVFHVT